MTTTQLKKVCILRLSAIGDVCHAVAVVQAIQRQYPEAQITWIVGKIEHSLLSALPGIRFEIYDKKQGLKGLWALRQRLKNERFDVLLHMQLALRASLVSLCIKAKKRIGFDKQTSKEGQGFFVNAHAQCQPNAHVIEGFKAFAKAINVDIDTFSWDMALSESERAFAKSALPHQGKTLVIVPAASNAIRNWLIERYAAVANWAIEQGINVVLCGGPSTLEKDMAAQIQSQVKGETLNLIGQTSLRQLLAVLERADAVLSPDTGPAHMATTVATPVVGLYANSNSKRTGPYYSLDSTINAYERLAPGYFDKPLSEVKWGARIKQDDVMESITVEEVVSALKKLLG